MTKSNNLRTSITTLILTLGLSAVAGCTLDAGLVITVPPGHGSDLSQLLAQRETPVLSVTSDVKAGKSLLSMVTDDNGNLTGANFSTTGSGAATPTQAYSLDQLRSGVVLLQISKGSFTRDVIRLSAPSLDSKGGGEIIVTLLREYGIFSDDYRKFHVELKNNAGAWQLNSNEKDGRRPFETAFVKALKIDGSLKGIDSITVYNKGSQVGEYNTSNLESESRVTH